MEKRIEKLIKLVKRKQKEHGSCQNFPVNKATLIECEFCALANRLLVELSILNGEMLKKKIKW